MSIIPESSGIGRCFRKIKDKLFDFVVAWAKIDDSFPRFFSEVLRNIEECLGYIGWKPDRGFKDWTTSIRSRWEKAWQENTLDHAYLFTALNMGSIVEKDTVAYLCARQFPSLPGLEWMGEWKETLPRRHAALAGPKPRFGPGNIPTEEDMVAFRGTSRITWAKVSAFLTVARRIGQAGPNERGKLDQLIMTPLILDELAKVRIPGRRAKAKRFIGPDYSACKAILVAAGVKFNATGHIYRLLPPEPEGGGVSHEYLDLLARHLVSLGLRREKRGPGKKKNTPRPR